MADDGPAPEQEQPAPEPAEEAVLKKAKSSKQRPNPSRDKDDVRQAATMAVGVAGSVATAALAILAVLGAIVTYVAANYTGLTMFYVLAAIAALTMILAVYLGIRGITEITNKGYEGTWLPWTDKHLFDKQALSTLVGILALAGAIAAGFTSVPKPSASGSAGGSRQVARALIQTLYLEQRLAATDGELARILRRLDHADSR